MELISDIRKTIIKIYNITYSSDEKYGLQSQIRRAAVSISLNIVEGNARKNSKEYLNFLRISLASLEEVIECLNISHELNIINNKKLKEIELELISIRKRIYGLQRYLKSEIRNPKSD